MPPTIVNPTGEAEWEVAAREAILDLLTDRLVVPWVEAEARIWQGWKDYPHAQPLPLNAARQKLRSEGAIIEETTRHAVPVTTVRLPYPAGRQKELQRLAGRRRKKFRKYLAWTGNPALCGHHAERVVFESTQAVATDAGLYVPKQPLGKITEVDGVEVPRGRTFDVLAHVLELPRLQSHTPLVFEVKNIHRWIYPWAKELWELLIKAAELSLTIPVLPALVCVRYQYATQRMAQDIGFLVAGMRDQLFSPAIDERQFAAVRDEFGLAILRHDGPKDEVMNFGRFIRQTPAKEADPWYRRQVPRFRALARIILDHDSLAESLPEDARTRVFARFRAQVLQAQGLTFIRGW